MGKRVGRGVEEGWGGELGGAGDEWWWVEVWRSGLGLWRGVVWCGVVWCGVRLIARVSVEQPPTHESARPALSSPCASP